jgi:hypothetical protein
LCLGLGTLHCPAPKRRVLSYAEERDVQAVLEVSGGEWRVVAWC